jgi:hypothetical protein
MNRHTCRLVVLSAIAMALVSALAPGAAAQGTEPPAGAAATPRMPDGKPDLSGNWLGVGVGGARSRRCAPGQGPCDINYQTNQSWDQEFIREDIVAGEVWFSGRWAPNRPLYKPEHWDRIQFLDENTNTQDPILRCQPQGITREDPPSKIMQTESEIVLFYGSQYFRIIPIDGRKHDPELARDITYWGHSVGTWEGDTLVIDSVGFNDATWLARGGLFHSDNMRVVEKFRREGNILVYDVTVEDPDVLLEPWVLDTRRIKLDPTIDFITETPPCRDYDSPNLGESKIRH